jgi:hypothetical protein
MANISSTQILPPLRLAIGGASWAFPEKTGRLFGFTSTQESAYLARLFGVRDLALAVGVLTGSAESRKLWWRVGIVCDAADAAAGVIGLRSGAPKRAMIMSTLTAVNAVALGVGALLESRAEA